MSAKSFNSVDELKTKIDNYFIYCDTKPRPYTVLSMCIYLDICRDTLCEYAKLEGYSDTIKKAKARIEAYAEDILFTSKTPVGVIFNLKNNFNWRDKTEVESSGTLDTTSKVDLTGYSVQQLKDMLKDE